MKTTIFRDFARYASLNVLGMLALSGYILADTFFVSKGLGTNGLTALNLAIPVYSFIHGSGLMIGMGGGIRYAVYRSRGEQAAADRIFMQALYLAAAFAAFFVLAGLFFTGTILFLFGADDSVFGMADTYLRVILLFAPAFLLNNVLLCFVRNDGAPQLSMAAMIGGSLSNVVLDWVFIFPCGMGIFGAAFATGLAPVISLLILLPHRLRGKNGFHAVRCRPEGRPLAGILSSGVPSLVTEVSSGVVMIVFNSILLRLAGNVGVAAYGVIANLSLVVIAIYTGIAQGIQPIVSRCTGQGDRHGAGMVLRCGLIAMLALSAVIYAGVFFGAASIAAVFNSEGDPRLQQLAADGPAAVFHRLSVRRIQRNPLGVFHRGRTPAAGADHRGAARLCGDSADGVCARAAGWNRRRVVRLSGSGAAGGGRRSVLSVLCREKGGETGGEERLVDHTIYTAASRCATEPAGRLPFFQNS